MANNILKSIRTIAQSLIDKADYDKTRTGRIAGTNPITNTYTVEVDGHLYNNVRTINDFSYSVGDVVKVHIPCNQPTQIYIIGSSLSDESIGKKTAQALALGEENSEAITSLTSEVATIIDELGNVYQLYITTTYTLNNVIYNAVLTQNGIDITNDTTSESGSSVPKYSNDMLWYTKTTTDIEYLGIGASITVPKNSLYYGQVITVWWTRRAYAYLLNNNNNNFVDSNGNKIIVRTNDNLFEEE